MIETEVIFHVIYKLGINVMKYLPIMYRIKLALKRHREMSTSCKFI